MVLGICGLVVCPLILSIPVIILGTQAKREIDKSAGREGGRGMATAGIIMGWIGVVFALLGIALIVMLGLIGSSIDSGTDFEENLEQDPFSLLRPALAVIRVAATMFF